MLFNTFYGCSYVLTYTWTAVSTFPFLLEAHFSLRCSEMVLVAITVGTVWGLDWEDFHSKLGCFSHSRSSDLKNRHTSPPDGTLEGRYVLLNSVNVPIEMIGIFPSVNFRTIAFFSSFFFWLLLLCVPVRASPVPQWIPILPLKGKIAPIRVTQPSNTQKNPFTCRGQMSSSVLLKWFVNVRN